MLLFQLLFYLAAIYCGALGLALACFPFPRWRKLPLLGLLIGMGCWLWYAGIMTPLSGLLPPHLLVASIGHASLLLMGISLLWLGGAAATRIRRWVVISSLMTAIGLVSVIGGAIALFSGSHAIGPLPTLMLGDTAQRITGIWFVSCWLLCASRLSVAALFSTGFARFSARHLLLIVPQTILIPSLTPLVKVGKIVSQFPLLLLIMTGLVLTTNAIAILAHHPTPHPHRVLRTGVVYLLTTGILLLIFAVSLPHLSFYCVAVLHLDPYFAVMMIAVCAILGSPLLLRATDVAIRQLLLRTYKRSQVDLQLIARRLNTTRDRHNLVARIEETFRELFLPCHLGIYCKAGDELALATPTADYPPTFSLADPFIISIQRQITLTPAYLEEIAGWDFVSLRMQQFDTAMIIPFALDDVLHGVALVGPKCSGDVYTDEDVSFCEVIRHQVAIALAQVESQEQLHEMIETLDARVRQQTDALREANTQLREADQAKNTFLALVSHELVTPLTSILGWSDPFIQTRSAEDMGTALVTIHRSGERLKRLVDDLLDISRMIHGKLAIVFQQADLWELTLQAIEEARQRIKEKNQTLIVIPPPAALPVTADPYRMMQVITNLLNNATKFSPEGSTITVVGRQTDRFAVIEVQDTGNGISAETLPVIFTLFKQAPSKQPAGGLGIGLALVKGILDLHQGQVSAYSAGEGQGSSFTIELPLIALDSAKAIAPPTALQNDRALRATSSTAQNDQIDNEASNILSEADMPESLQHAAMKQLAAEFIFEMRTATVMGDADRLRALITQLEEQHAALAQHLHTLADNYEYDRLISLFTAEDNSYDACPS